MGKCKDCKWWKELLLGKNVFGPCRIGKRSDDFIYHTKHWADDKVMVGANFGCIHFERSKEMLVKAKFFLAGDKARDFRDCKPDDVFKTEVVDVVYCCVDMKDAWEDSVFSLEMHGKGVVCRYENETRFPLVKFCPFCGKGVRVEKAEIVKLAKKAVSQWGYVEEAIDD